MIYICTPYVQIYGLQYLYKYNVLVVVYSY